MAGKKERKKKKSKKGCLANLTCYLASLFCCLKSQEAKTDKKRSGKKCAEPAEKEGDFPNPIRGSQPPRSPPCNSTLKNGSTKSLSKVENKPVTSEVTQNSPSPPSTPGSQRPSGSSGLLSLLSGLPSLVLGQPAVGSRSESAVTGRARHSEGNCKQTVSNTSLPSTSSGSNHTPSWPAVSSIRASSHQGSATWFSSPWAGNQCTSMSLVAVALPTVKPVHTWTRDDLDSILFNADRVHGRLLASMGRSPTHSIQRVGVSELRGRRVPVSLNGSHVTMLGRSDTESYGVVYSTEPSPDPQREFGMVSLEEGLQTALHDTSGAVLTVGDYSVGIIPDPEGGLRAWDSHSRGPGGLMHPDGRAVLTKLGGLGDLSTLVRLQLLQRGGADEQFDVMGFSRVL